MGQISLLRFSTIRTIAFWLTLYLFQNQKSIERFFLGFVGLGVAVFSDSVSGVLKRDALDFGAAFGSNYFAAGIIYRIHQ